MKFNFPSNQFSTKTKRKEKRKEKKKIIKTPLHVNLLFGRCTKEVQGSFLFLIYCPIYYS
jgi:hypothetical protein